jgi:hypothetical protein
LVIDEMAGGACERLLVGVMVDPDSKKAVPTKSVGAESLLGDDFDANRDHNHGAF